MAKGSDYSVEELEQMLTDKREAELDELRAERAELQKKVDEVDTKIVAAGGTPPSTGGKRGGGRRFRNQPPLHEVLSGILKGKKSPMALDDIEDAVQKSGYKTTAKNPRNVIYQNLYKGDNFVREGKGWKLGS